MKKLLALIPFALVAAGFAQDDVDEYEDFQPEGDDAPMNSSAFNADSPTAVRQARVEGVSTGPYEPVATEVRQARNTDDDPLPAPKRPAYNFRSWGLGLGIWHNWEDSEKNPKRDWDQAVLFHYGRIWEMTTHGAITFMDNANISVGDHFELHETALIGGRFFFADQVFSPYVGAGFGVGIQFDSHYDDFSEGFAFGFAGGLEAGLVIFRTSTTQLEIGAGYDIMMDGFDTDCLFGSFNFYLAVNY